MRLTWMVIVMTVVTVLGERVLMAVVARMKMMKLSLSMAHLYHSWV